MTLEAIRSAVEVYFNTDLTVRSRKHGYYFPRVIFYRIAYDNISCTLQVIGDELGYGHASVLNALNQFQGIIDKYKKIEHAYYDLLDILIEPYFEKKKYENEKTRLLRQSYEKKIQEIRLKNTIKVNKLKIQNELLSGLLELSEYDLKDFHETRIVPYLRMNGINHEKLNNIEVNLKAV